MIKTDAMTKTQEDFFIKIYTSHFIARVRKGLCVRGSWRPNITEIFWPRSYGRQRCVFLVLHGCSTGVPESTLLGAGFPYYTSSLSLSNSTHQSTGTSTSTVLLLFNSSAFYYLQTPTRWYRHASAISSDIWRSGCVTSAIFGMACAIAIERK